MYICKLLAPLLSLIEPYLRDARFLHVTRMGRGCELDSTLVNALVERRRPDTHTFHLPCDECIVTLEDVQLQLRLSVDGLVVTGLVVTGADWKSDCFAIGVWDRIWLYVYGVDNTSGVIVLLSTLQSTTDESEEDERLIPQPVLKDGRNDEDEEADI
ncbi:hypothetical protein Gotur_001731 [Gossypium turneri]